MGKTRVQVFTASGTYKGEFGTIDERTITGAWVRLDDGDRVYFGRKELVPCDEGDHFAGAE